MNLCESNNVAARLIVSGNLREAYRILQEQTAQACEALSSWGSNVDAEDPGYKTTEDQVSATVLKNDEPLLQETNVFLLPFIIHNQFENQTLHTKLPAICAILVYNMAVCCHAFSYASKDDRKRQQALSQARHLYSESTDLLRHLHLDGCLGQVFLGICTNMIELSFERADLVGVHNWYSLLTEKFGQSESKHYDMALCDCAFRSVVYYSGRMISARAA